MQRYTALGCATLQTAWCRSWFEEFARGSGVERNTGTITRRMRQYIHFFEELEHHFDTPNDIDQEQLLRRFGAERLRRSFRIIEFFVERKGVPWDPELQDCIIENKRIDQSLAVQRDQPWYGELLQYRQHFTIANRKARPLAPKSIRVYVRSAITLMERSHVDSIRDLTQTLLLRVLRRSRGLQASLSPFVRFANRRFATVLELPPQSKPNAIRKEQALRKKVTSLMKRLRSTAKRCEAKALLAQAISLVYQIPLRSLLSLRRKDLLQEDHHLSLRWNEAWLTLESSLADQACRWLSQGEAGDFLFPGRTKQQNLSTATVHYHVQRRCKPK